MPEQVRASMSHSSRRIGQLVEQVRRLPEGQELLEALDCECGYGKTVFNRECERQSNFNQGKQHVANWLHEKHEKYLNQGGTDEE